MSETLEQVLQDAVKEATVLRQHGHQDQAKTLERMAEKVRASAEEYLDWLPEQLATLYTGRAVPWLRARFAGWEARGLARWAHRRRQYRRIVLEHRGNVDAARAAGERAVRELRGRR